MLEFIQNLISLIGTVIDGAKNSITFLFDSITLVPDLLLDLFNELPTFANYMYSVLLFLILFVIAFNLLKKVK